jgi:hypothetical protein
MQVAANTPQTAGRLLAIRPDVGKLLAVVAQCKGILRFIRLYPDGNVAEAREFEDCGTLPLSARLPGRKVG